MKITEHIKNAKGKTLFSFELLPPVKGNSIKGIYDAIDPLMEFNPPFIDVTYHREDYIYKEREDGLLEKVSYRKRPGTVAICAAIMNRYKVDAVPHLICGGFTKEETENALIDLQFLGIDNVPRKAITMGIGTVLSAKRIVLLGWGANKAEILKDTVEGEITSEVPATYLQHHNNTSFIIDESASSELTRVKTPWLVTSCVWDESLKLKAVVWLSELLNKSILNSLKLLKVYRASQ